MKDAKDHGTMELLEEPPYLVISTTKKGFREFKPSWDNNYLGIHSWRWNKSFASAARWKMDDLPKLLAAIRYRRAVTVGVVIRDELHVLGVSTYPLDLLKK